LESNISTPHNSYLKDVDRRKRDGYLAPDSEVETKIQNYQENIRLINDSPLLSTADKKN